MDAQVVLLSKNTIQCFMKEHGHNENEEGNSNDQTVFKTTSIADYIIHRNNCFLGDPENQAPHFVRSGSQHHIYMMLLFQDLCQVY